MLRMDFYASLIPFIKEHKETEIAYTQPARNSSSLPSYYWVSGYAKFAASFHLCKEGIILEIQGLMSRETTSSFRASRNYQLL